MSEREPVICPGCGRPMGVTNPVLVEGLGIYDCRMFCPCGWTAPHGAAKEREAAIDKAFENARKRSLGEE